MDFEPSEGLKFAHCSHLLFSFTPTDYSPMSRASPLPPTLYCRPRQVTPSFSSPALMLPTPDQPK